MIHCCNCIRNMCVPATKQLLAIIFFRFYYNNKHTAGLLERDQSKPMCISVSSVRHTSGRSLICKTALLTTSSSSWSSISHVFLIPFSLQNLFTDLTLNRLSSGKAHCSSSLLLQPSPLHNLRILPRPPFKIMI